MLQYPKTIRALTLRVLKTVTSMNQEGLSNDWFFHMKNIIRALQRSAPEQIKEGGQLVYCMTAWFFKLMRALRSADNKRGD